LKCRHPIDSKKSRSSFVMGPRLCDGCTADEIGGRGGAAPIRLGVGEGLLGGRGVLKKSNVGTEEADAIAGELEEEEEEGRAAACPTTLGLYRPDGGGGGGRRTGRLPALADLFRVLVCGRSCTAGRTEEGPLEAGRRIGAEAKEEVGCLVALLLAAASSQDQSSLLAVPVAPAALTTVRGSSLYGGVEVAGRGGRTCCNGAFARLVEVDDTARESKSKRSSILP
jgi:hypothetical protein